MATRNRMRILLGALICCTMLLGMLPTLALAESIPAFSGGAGTQTNPYLISSAADLVELQTFVNTGKAEQYGPNYGNFEGYYFKQTADIDLTGIDWDPIGYSGSYYFAGNYDGDNFFIQNAVSDGKVDTDGYSTAGIFGWAAFGSISNLHVDNADFIATGTRNYSYVGGIAGVAYGASITNCSVSNSKIESRRTNNNNCAGSICGFATGGTFANCAAENNTIKSMTYGGGFVGEIDDDYGAGTSAFTNCYVAGCNVTTSTQEVQGMNISGGFAGELTASALTVTNCFVYNTKILIGENTKVPSGLQFTGLFAGNQWQTATMSPINAVNCYYGAVDVTQRAGAASEKSNMAFVDGTVMGLLGSAFAQGAGCPVLRSVPARLTAINVTRAPSKTAYLVGDNFDPTDMVVSADYSNLTSKDITDYIVTNGTDLTAGQTSVTIRYTERGTTKETTQTIRVNPAAPAMSPAAGIYTTAQHVTLSCTTTGATIRYTTNGDEPTETSTEYTAAIPVSATTTIKAKAFLTNGATSETMAATYTITGTVAAPVSSPAAGTYITAQNVTLSCTMPGATIRYTTDGNEPTEASVEYTAVIPVSATTIIKAKAFLTDWAVSETMTATYTITGTVAAPVASPVAGTYTTAQSVTLSCATAGATIRYTTNGDEPTETSTRYTAAIPVDATTTIKAKAFKTDWATSDTSTAAYTITGAAPSITAQPKDQNVEVGQQATFTIAATGDRLTYQWYINRGDGLDWIQLDGTTGTSHTTTPVTLENDGYRYFCRVTDAHGRTVDSGVAILHVSKVVIPPKTGDSSTPLLWLGLFLLGGAGLLTLTLFRRRRT